MPERKNTPFVITLTSLLLVMYLFTPDISLYAASFSSGLSERLSCHFHHANIFHLSANVLCLYLMDPTPGRMVMSYPLAAAATLFAPDPVSGISGMLYACMGLGITHSSISLEGWITFIAINAITIFVPGIAFAMHTASFVLGITTAFIIGRYADRRTHP